MKKIKIRLFLVFCLVLTRIGYSQTTGDQPSNTKWNYIENNTVKVIFTDSLETEAKRTADMIDFIAKNKTVSIGDKSKKIDLLLNANTTISNGYTRLAPYMIEFYGTPFQNSKFLGSTNWLDGLAIHEYRHALQFNNARRGLTKFSSYIFGEIGWTVPLFISVPNWYMEGDAVMAETLLTDAGRGRLPSFFEEQRVLLLNNKNYSYAEARNGSFRDLLPNHYPLGYAIVNYGRNHYGAKLWSDVLVDAGGYKKFFYPFSEALKARTQLGTKKMYLLAYAELKQKWEEELKNTPITPSTDVTRIPAKTVTNYRFPHFLEDGSVLCIKSSFNETPKLVQIIDGKEKYLTTIGVATESFLSVNGTKVAWTEIKKDPRRDAVTYNAIIEFDWVSQIKRTVITKGKFFSPQFSADGNKIVAVNVNENLRNSIQIIDVKNGVTIQTLSNPENDFLSYPKWTNDNKTIVYIAKHNSKIALMQYDLASNKKIPLTPWSSNPIGNYTINKDKIYFSASYSGINNIYSIDLNGNNAITQISSVKIGADTPAISKNGKTLYFSELSTMGHQIKKMELSRAIAKTTTITEPTNMPRYGIETTVIEHNILDSIPTNKYVKKVYSGILKGTKLHSWLPYFSQTAYRFDLQLNNILNDFSAYIGSTYNLNENNWGYHATIDYAKYFIPIHINVNSTERTTNTISGNKITYEENTIGMGFSLPLSWYDGNYFRGFNLKSTFTNISESNYKINNISIYNNSSFTDLQIGLKVNNIKSNALQNTNNKWSQSLALLYDTSLNNNVRAGIISGNLKVELPGIGKNDGLTFNFKAKKELLTNDYLFQDNFEHSRGYSIIANDKETVLSTNYSFPLFYPHAGVGGILYCNRLVTNLFCDLGNVKRNTTNTHYKQNSLGAEFIFNVTFLNVLPTNIGIRNSFLLNTDYSNLERKYQFGIFIATSL